MVEEVKEVKEVKKVEEEEEEKEKKGIVMVVREGDFLGKGVAKMLFQILHLVIMRMLIPKRLTKNSPKEKNIKTEI